MLARIAWAEAMRSNLYLRRTYATREQSIDYED
jgi:hypothetical protein